MSDFNKTSFCRDIIHDEIHDCNPGLSTNTDSTSNQHHFQQNSKGVSSILARIQHIYLPPRRGCIIHTSRRRISLLFSSNSKT